MGSLRHLHQGRYGVIACKISLNRYESQGGDERARRFLVALFFSHAKKLKSHEVLTLSPKYRFPFYLSFHLFSSGSSHHLI